DLWDSAGNGILATACAHTYPASSSSFNVGVAHEGSYGGAAHGFPGVAPGDTGNVNIISIRYMVKFLPSADTDEFMFGAMKWVEVPGVNDTGGLGVAANALNAGSGFGPAN